MQPPFHQQPPQLPQQPQPPRMPSLSNTNNNIPPYGARQYVQQSQQGQYPQQPQGQYPQQGQQGQPQNLPRPPPGPQQYQQPSNQNPQYQQPPSQQYQPPNPHYGHQQPIQSPTMPNIPGQPYPQMRPPMPMPMPPAPVSPHQQQTQYQPQQQPQYQQTAPPMQKSPSAVGVPNQMMNMMMMPPPQQQQQQQPPVSKQSIHPSNIPSPLKIVEEEVNRFRDGPFFMSQLLTRVIPPRCGVDVQVIDDGQSSCRFIRPTCWTLPVSEELAEQTRLPIGLTIQPFAPLPSHEPPVPVIDFGPRGPIRCNRCRGYVNPAVTFVRGGRAWQCNLCGAVNEVPDEYYAALDATGRRVDVHLRPELRSGTVDIIAPSDYNLRPVTTTARLVFLVDASRAAVQSGAFKAAIDSIRHVIKDPDCRRTYSHVALCTFDRSLHAYNFAQSQAMIMSDLADPFMPLGPAAMFYPVADLLDHQDNMDRLLTGLMALFADTRTVESCLGSAVSVAVESLKGTGGRVFVFASQLANAGPGGLRQRPEASQPVDKVNPLMAPQGDYYTKLADLANSNGISVSMCVTPTAFIDLATIGQLTSHTGGSLLVYSRFTQDSLHAEQLRDDVLMTVCKPFVYDCMARVRCGEGLQVRDYFGPCTPTAPGVTSRPDVQFGALCCDQAFAVTLQYDGRLVENDTTGIQCAILHTTPSGQRRIRVINLALPCTKQPVEVFRSCDYEAIVSVLTKQAVSPHRLATSALSQITNQFMFSRVSQVLAAYRKAAASNVAASQLILPEELRLLPVFLLSVMKTAAFSPITGTVDVRQASARLLLDLPNDLLFHHFYPRLYNLLGLADVSSSANRVPLMRLSRESLDRQGVYLFENGMKMIIWVGDMVPAPVLTNLFGVPQIGSINPHMKLPRLNNSLSSSVNDLIESIRGERVRYLSLQVIRQGIDQSAEADLLQSILVEDGSPAGPSYADFLCRLHGQVQHDVGGMSGSGSLLADKSALLSFFH